MSTAEYRDNGTAEYRDNGTAVIALGHRGQRWPGAYLLLPVYPRRCRMLASPMSTQTAFWGAATIDLGAYDMTQIGVGNLLASGASYGGFMILWFAAFQGELSSRENLSVVRRGMRISSLFVFGTAVLCCVSLISNIDPVRTRTYPRWCWPTG